MDKPDFKIHTLDAKADPRPTTPEQEERAVRYVALPDYVPAGYPDEDSIDLLALWRVLVAYRRLLLGVFLLGMLLAAGVAFLSTPVYRAELVMAPANEKEGGKLSVLAGQFGGLASLAGVNLGSGGNNVDKVLATLKSRAFLVPFLREEKIPALYAKSASGEAPSLLEVYENFAEDVLAIRKDSKTGLVNLAVEWPDPALAARWANALVTQLNEHQRKAAIQQAQQSIDYLNQQLDKTTVVDMQQVIYRLIESQSKVIMLANVKQEYAMQVVDPAMAPEKPVRPQRTLILVLGLVLSIMLGVFVAFLLHGLKNFRQQMHRMQ